MIRQGLLDEGRLLDGGGAEDDAVYAVRQGAADVVSRAETSAELDGNPHGCRDSPHLGGLRTASLPRPIEVDEVDPRRGVGCELHGDAHRVVVEGGLAVVVALQESNHRSVAEVYGGDNLHGR